MTEPLFKIVEHDRWRFAVKLKPTPIIEYQQVSLHWDKLHRRVKAYTRNPIEEIERIAQQALSEGYIDRNRYFVIEQRVPFRGVEKLPLEDIGLVLGITRERVRQLEASAYVRLLKYLDRK